MNSNFGLNGELSNFLDFSTLLSNIPNNKWVHYKKNHYSLLPKIEKQNWEEGGNQFAVRERKEKRKREREEKEEEERRRRRKGEQKARKRR